jgi:5-methylcytosine-specific restriction protein A
MEIKSEVMPKSPKKVKRPWVKERKPFERAVSNYSFYNSRKWRKAAERFKQANPLCVMCQDEGKVTPAQFADHIIRIEDGGSRFDESNLQSLCEFHHNQKSGREAHGYKQQPKNISNDSR